MKTKLLTLLCTLMCAGNLFAYDFYVDDIFYNKLGGDSVEVNIMSSYYCTSSSVTIPETVTYSNTTYRVTKIGRSAFSDCSGLTSIDIPNSVTTIGERAFAYCSGLTSIDIPNSVTTIGDAAFDGCSGLTSVTIPNSVTTIGQYAFFGCSGLTSVTIPNSVTTIGQYAFFDCSGLTSVTLNSNVICSKTYSEYYNLCKIFGSQVEEYCIGNAVTTIGKRAFSDCEGLTSIDIPNSVTTIGQYAFSGCSDLTSIIIPSSVTTIGNYAFRDCSGLTSITCYAINPPTCYYSFDGVDTSIPVYVPAQSVDAYKQAEEWKEFWNIQPIEDTGIKELFMNSSHSQVTKLMKGGQLHILHNGKMYNALGF